MNPLFHRTAAAFAAAILSAQAPAPSITSAQQPDLTSLSAAVRTMRRTAPPSGDAQLQIDKLASDAQAAGQTGEARRGLAHAYTLLSGQTWNASQEFAWSLALRYPEVTDSALPLIAHLTQSYPALPPATRGLKLRATLRSGNGRSPRDLGTFDLFSRDLIEQPFGFESPLKGLPDGAYTLDLDVSDGGATVATLSRPLQVVHGIYTDRESIEKRLERISGHESTKASVRYPYVLAETVNVGRRQLSPADFGLPFQPQLPYDFMKGVQTSADLLKSLEAGNDPLFRAKGNSERHYWFPEAREMMAYHVYAPRKWDGKAKLPMVLVLHGNTRDQDYYFDRDEQLLAKLAEQHGYLVVCPMGYRPSAGWGSNSLNSASASANPARALQGELSEKDALNVLALIQEEYPIDRDRTYLFGHSAGGAGTWYIGEKYADKWAAIATSAAATRAEGFPFQNLKELPLMVCHGEADDEVPVARSRDMVKAAKEHGLDPKYLEVPGATHLTIVAIVEPKVFDFFDQHTRRQK